MDFMELKDYIKIELDGLKRNLDKILKDLTPVDLAWRPACGCNSIGLILFHCARSEDSFIQGSLSKKAQIFEKWCLKMKKAIDDRGGHYSVEQVNGFIVPDVKDMLEYWAEVRTATISYLDYMNPTDFENKIKMPWGEFTTAGIFSMIISHASGHIGEMSYLRGLLKGMDK
jgi:hypothetical protein